MKLFRHIYEYVKRHIKIWRFMYVLVERNMIRTVNFSFASCFFKSLLFSSFGYKLLQVLLCKSNLSIIMSMGLDSFRSTSYLCAKLHKVDFCRNSRKLVQTCRRVQQKSTCTYKIFLHFNHNETNKRKIHSTKI